MKFHEAIAAGIRHIQKNKPVPFESIPKFQDRVRLGDAFKGALLDVMLLLLFFFFCLRQHTSHSSTRRYNNLLILPAGAERCA